MRIRVRWRRLQVWARSLPCGSQKRRISWTRSWKRTWLGEMQRAQIHLHGRESCTIIVIIAFTILTISISSAYSESSDNNNGQSSASTSRLPQPMPQVTVMPFNFRYNTTPSSSRLPQSHGYNNLPDPVSTVLPVPSISNLILGVCSQSSTYLPDPRRTKLPVGRDTLYPVTALYHYSRHFVQRRTY